MWLPLSHISSQPWTCTKEGVIPSAERGLQRAPWSWRALCTGRERQTLREESEPRPERQRGLPCTTLGRKGWHRASRDRHT